MKNIYVLISAIVLFTSNVIAQTTLVLQPGSADGKDAVANYCVPCGFSTVNFGNTDHLSVATWTYQGSTSTARSLIQFDLSSIPDNAIITSATLSLYYCPNPSNGDAGQSTISGSNAAWIQRITSAWDENTVTGASAPSSTTQNQATIPASVSATQDYPNLDVTTLVQDMVNNPAQSFGFMIRLQTESYYRALIFCTSDYSDPSKHPMLTVTYNLQGLSTASTQTNVSCNGRTDGTAKVSVKHGTPPFTFSWLPIVSSDSVATGLAPGNYLCAVSDSGNVNSQNIFFVITQPAVLSLTPSGTNPLCLSSNGIAKVTPVGGTSPFTYRWWNDSTTQSVTGLSAGIYTVDVTDKNGCTASGADTLTTQTASFTLTKTRVNPPCGFTNGSANVTPVGGASPYTYLWSNGATTKNITNVGWGTDSVTVTDHNGCVLIDTVIINSKPIPTDSVPDICMVTVDSLSQNNIIMWNNSAYYHQAVDSFIVYREITSNSFQPIGAVAFNEVSMFVDTVRTLYFPNTGNPNAGTYRYKIGVKDKCGNLSALSPWQNTLFIVNNNGVFTWPYPYAIENKANPVIAYILYRNDNGIGSWHAVNSVAGTQQFVTDPDYNAYKNTATWCVATQWDINCTPTARMAQTGGISYNSSRSNSQGNTLPTNVNNISNDNLFSIFPNPATNRLTVHSSATRSGDGVLVSIINVLGQETLSSTALSFKGEDAVIDISKLTKGMYFLQMKSASENVVKRFVKE